MIRLISKPNIAIRAGVIPTLTPKKENWISVIAPAGVTDAIFPVDPSPNQMCRRDRSDESWIAQGRVTK